MQTVQQQGLKGFAQHHRIERLSQPTLHAISENQPGYSVEKAKQFLKFQDVNIYVGGSLFSDSLLFLAKIKRVRLLESG